MGFLATVFQPGKTGVVPLARGCQSGFSIPDFDISIFPGEVGVGAMLRTTWRSRVRPVRPSFGGDRRHSAWGGDLGGLRPVEWDLEHLGPACARFAQTEQMVGVQPGQRERIGDIRTDPQRLLRLADVG